MKHLPYVESMDRIGQFEFGPRNTILFFNNIKQIGKTEYAFMLTVVNNDTGEPVCVVASERNKTASSGEASPHVLTVFDDEGQASLGASNDWSDPQKFFLEALRIVSEHPETTQHRAKGVSPIDDTKTASAEATGTNCVASAATANCPRPPNMSIINQISAIVASEPGFPKPGMRRKVCETFRDVFFGYEPTAEEIALTLHRIWALWDEKFCDTPRTRGFGSPHYILEDVSPWQENAIRQLEDGCNG